MPNWVFNHLSVTCENEEQKKAVLDSFTNEVEKEDGSKELEVTYSKMLPMPEELTDTTSGSITNNGYFLLYGNTNIDTRYKDKNFSDKIEQRLNQKITLDDSMLAESPRLLKGKFKSVVQLVDIYFSTHPDKTEVTYLELVNWIKNVNIEEVPNSELVSNYRKSLMECDKQIHCIKHHGHPTWYEWANESWGVKWDASYSRVEVNDLEVNFHFDSPWSRPIPVIQKFSTVFPTLSFNLCSGYEAESFSTTDIFENGENVHSEMVYNEFEDDFGNNYNEEESDIRLDYFGDTYYQPEGYIDFDTINNHSLVVSYVQHEDKPMIQFEYGYKLGNKIGERISYGVMYLEIPESAKDKKALDILVEATKQMKDKLDKKFGHYLSWTFNKQDLIKQLTD